MGKPAARIGDMHMCPMVTPGLPPIPHVGGPVTGPGCPTVLIGGMPAAVMGDMCVCVGPPDTIVLGSTGVLIGGKPAARMGDQCAHGGAITLGCPTVLIGETSAGGGGGAGGGGLAAMPTNALANVMNSAPPEFAKNVAQVIVLIEAAINGTPFCEKCEEEALKSKETVSAGKESGVKTSSGPQQVTSKPNQDGIGSALAKQSEVRQATKEEAEKIDELRKEHYISKHKNIAFAKGKLDGKVIDVFSQSGKSSDKGIKPKPFGQQQLKTHPTNKDIEKGLGLPDRRAYDSEVVLLEKLLEDTTPASTGSIKIVSERVICDSCANAITQFEKLRPGIKVERVSTNL